MDTIENIYKVGEQKHNCPCTVVREIKNFTKSLVKRTRPAVDERRVSSIAGELIGRAINEMENSRKTQVLKTSTPPTPQGLKKTTPVSTSLFVKTIKKYYSYWIVLYEI